LTILGGTSRIDGMHALCANFCTANTASKIVFHNESATLADGAAANVANFFRLWRSLYSSSSSSIRPRSKTCFKPCNKASLICNLKGKFSGTLIDASALFLHLREFSLVSLALAVIQNKRLCFRKHGHFTFNQPASADLVVIWNERREVQTKKLASPDLWAVRTLCDRQRAQVL
jgi:hypothetical protein